MMDARPHTSASFHTSSHLDPLTLGFPAPPSHQIPIDQYLSSLNPHLPCLNLHLGIVDQPENGPVRYPLPETRPLDDTKPPPSNLVEIDALDDADGKDSGLPGSNQTARFVAQEDKRPRRPGTADALSRATNLGPTSHQKDQPTSRQLSSESPKPAIIASMAIMSAPDLTTSRMKPQTNLGQLSSLSPRPKRRDLSHLPPPSSPPKRALPPTPSTPPKPRPVVRSANGLIVSPDSPLYTEFARQAEIRQKKQEALSNIPRRPLPLAVAMRSPDIGVRGNGGSVTITTAEDHENSTPIYVSPADTIRNAYLAQKGDERDDHGVLRPSERRGKGGVGRGSEERPLDHQVLNQRETPQSRRGSVLISKDDQRTMEAWFADERYGGRMSLSEPRPIRSDISGPIVVTGNLGRMTPEPENDQGMPVPLSDFRFPAASPQPHTPGNSPERIQRLSLTEDLLLRNSIDYPERACIWESISPIALAQQEAAAKRRRAASPTGSASTSTPHLLTSLADLMIRRSSSRTGEASLDSRVKETAAMLPMSIGAVQLGPINLAPLFEESPFTVVDGDHRHGGQEMAELFEDKIDTPPTQRLAIIRARLVYYDYVLDCLRSAGEILYADNSCTLELLQGLRPAGEELNQRPSTRILDHGMALGKAVQIEEAMDLWWKSEAQHLNRIWWSAVGHIRGLAEEHGRLVKMVPSEKILEIKVFERRWSGEVRQCRAERKARKWIQEAVAPAPVDEEYLTAISRDMELKGQLPGGAFRRFNHLAVTRRAQPIKEDKVDVILKEKIEGDLSDMKRNWGTFKGRAKAMVRNLGGKSRDGDKRKGGEVFGMIDTRHPSPHQANLGSFLQMDDKPIRQSLYGTHHLSKSSSAGSGISRNSTPFPTPESYLSRFKMKYRAHMNRSLTHFDRYPEEEDRSIYVDPAEDDRRCPWPCAGPVPAAYRGTFAPVPSPPQMLRAKSAGLPWPYGVDNTRGQKSEVAPRLVPTVPTPVPGPSGPRKEVWELDENQPEKVKDRVSREEKIVGRR